MTRFPDRLRPAAALALRLVLAALLSACATPTPVPTVSPTAPPATATPPPGPAPSTPIPTPTFIRPGDPVTLTLWTSPELAPAPDTPGGALLTVQLAAFEDSHAGVHVEIVRKKPYGPGGLLDVLSSAAPVAPTLLPDLMVLDAGELPAAARAGLLVPLDERVDPALAADLYPFARALGRVDGRLYGIPFAADAQHLAYNRAVQASPPLSWTQVLSGSGRLAFAAGNPGAMDATLADYLAAGGALTNTLGRPNLDLDPLVAVLRYYRAGLGADRLLDSVAQIDSSREAWELYRNGKTTQTLVNARLYLAERASLRSTEVGLPPGPHGPEPAIARAWVWAIPARADPGRQQLAVELLAWLTSPENLGEWCLADNRLPTRRAALGAWEPGDPYVSFLTNYLEFLVPQPPAEVDQRVSPAIYRAVQAVLINGVAPEVAAAAAVAEVEP